jgi:hypothetical protein
MNLSVDAHKLSSWMSGLQKAPSQLTVAELSVAATELKVPLPDLMQFVSLFAAAPAPGGGNQLSGGMAPGAVVPTPQVDLYSNDPTTQLKEAAQLLSKSLKELTNVGEAFYYEPELDPTIGVRASLDSGLAFEKAKTGIKNEVVGFLARRGYNIPESAITILSKDGGTPI